MQNTEKPRPRRAVVAAMIGFAVVLAYAITGVLQVLVWNPLAAVPGSTLEQIRAAMADADQPLSGTGVVTWGAIGIALAAVALVVTLLRGGNRLVLVVGVYLVLLIFAMPGHLFVAFGPGMSLADTFGISGADHAPWGVALYLVSAAALLALIVLIIRASRTAPAGTD